MNGIKSRTIDPLFCFIISDLIQCRRGLISGPVPEIPGNGAWKKGNAEIAGLSFLMHESTPTRNVSAQTDWQLRQLLPLNCDLIVRQYYYVNRNVTKIVSIHRRLWYKTVSLFFGHVRSSLLTFFLLYLWRGESVGALHDEWSRSRSR